MEMPLWLGKQSPASRLHLREAILIGRLAELKSCLLRRRLICPAFNKASNPTFTNWVACGSFPDVGKPASEARVTPEADIKRPMDLVR